MRTLREWAEITGNPYITIKNRVYKCECKGLAITKDEMYRSTDERKMPPRYFTPGPDDELERLAYHKQWL